MTSYSTTAFTAQAQADLLNVVPFKDSYATLAADFTLTSQTAAQKLFNHTALGALTLPTGVYEFEVFLDITGMSATSGGATLDILGAGTATLIAILQQAVGLDQTTQATEAAIGGAVSLTSTIDLAVAATGTALGASVKGTFNVSVAGTIIPAVALITAAAAVVKTGTMIRVLRLGDTAANYGGAWT